jgi:hypothetical protein
MRNLGEEEVPLITSGERAGTDRRPSEQGGGKRNTGSDGKTTVDDMDDGTLPYKIRRRAPRPEDPRIWTPSAVYAAEI